MLITAAQGWRCSQSRLCLHLTSLYYCQCTNIISPRTLRKNTSVPETLQTTQLQKHSIIHLAIVEVSSSSTGARLHQPWQCPEEPLGLKDLY